MEINTQKLNAFLGGPKDRAWEDGFLAGQKGDTCPADAPDSFVNGYGRGYEAAVMLEHNNQWFKQRGFLK